MGKKVVFENGVKISEEDLLTLAQAKQEAIDTMNNFANDEITALMPFLTLAKWLTGYLNNNAKNALVAQVNPICTKLDQKITAINACTTNDQVYAISWQ